MATPLSALADELLFGSAARGGDTPESDLDLLVDLRDPSLERVLDLADRLSASTGRAAGVPVSAMAEDGVRGVDRRRWQNVVVGLLERWTARPPASAPSC